MQDEGQVRAGDTWVSVLLVATAEMPVIRLLRRVLGPTFPMGCTTPRCAQTDLPEPGESWSQKNDPEGVQSSQQPYQACAERRNECAEEIIYPAPAPFRVSSSVRCMALISPFSLKSIKCWISNTHLCSSIHCQSPGRVPDGLSQP